MVFSCTHDHAYLLLEPRLQGLAALLHCAQCCSEHVDLERPAQADSESLEIPRNTEVPEYARTSKLERKISPQVSSAF